MSSDFLPSLLSSTWSIVLVVLFFGGSIFVHELGHFLAARWRGVHVERFSIGFGPAIFSWRGKDGVEYRLAWIPLGGYVLLPQLADLGPVEGRSETDVDSLPPVSYVSRMIVFVAGATFNILFALALATIIWFVGQPESSEMATTRIGYVAPTMELPNKQQVPSPASEAGLKIGDTIRAIDGTTVGKWLDVQYLISLGSGVTTDGRRQATFTVERDGRTFDVPVYPRIVGEEKDRRVGIAPGYELLVQQVAPDSLGAKAGFQAGDEILSLDGVRTLNAATYFDQLDTSAKHPVLARVKRAGATVELTIPARPDAKSASNLGLVLTTGFQMTHPSPFAQIGDHITKSLQTLWSLINPRSDVGLSKVSGPVGIVRIFHSAAEAGIRATLFFAILVNVNLAFFNLLPIPVLDGGQMLFATIGRLRGRALSPNFVVAAQSAFGILLLTMVVYVSFFDVRRWSRDASAERAEAAATAPAKP